MVSLFNAFFLFLKVYDMAHVPQPMPPTPTTSLPKCPVWYREGSLNGGYGVFSSSPPQPHVSGMFLFLSGRPQVWSVMFGKDADLRQNRERDFQNSSTACHQTPRLPQPAFQPQINEYPAGRPAATIYSSAAESAAGVVVSGMGEASVR